MAIRVPPIPIFSPPPLHLHHHNNTAPSEIRFSRWNNANAAPFIKRRREQEEIERDLRLHRILESASRITSDLPESTSPSSPSSDFKSRGTPSSPSFPSIPGRKSKYSKPTVRNPRSSDLSHPAFLPLRRTPRKIVPEEVVVDGEEGSASASATVKVGENGVSYVIENAPFEFQYSYTETPKVKPLGLREPLYMPFGPTTMPRPWTGRAPLPKSKKQLPEFDSFKPPPAGKKGVKPVQNPGPFLAGSGPKYARTREEVLGEPLTEEEVKEMVQACMKITRQMNIGRDGLTHNMLDNIHAHWKRRRVCKIKCKGVCTVDMDNVRQQLEEKTGGKVIYGRGGVIFLFRGRNYNYKTRPKFPLMLWKPSSPIYPRLVQKVPEGLTLEEATEMRKRGRELPPICKLGKNGVYINLVKDVKEAFEECELVRINCNGLNKSDVRKIGAKLKDLVPCVLISFEFEHILMWRGKDWKSSLPPPEDRCVMDVGSVTNTSAESSLDYVDPVVKDKSSMESNMVPSGLSKCIPLEVVTERSVLKEDNGIEKTSEESNDDVISHADDGEAIIVSGSNSSVSNQFEVPCEDITSFIEDLHSGSSKLVISAPSILEEDEQTISGCESTLSVESVGHQSVMPQRPYMDGVLLLLKQAIDNGSAVILDSNSLDANYIYERAVDLAKTAPPGPVFQHQIRKKAKHKVDKVHYEKTNLQEPQVIDVESVTSDEKKPVEKRKQKNQPALDLKEGFSTTVPHGSLRVDELAKLLG